MPRDTAAEPASQLSILRASVGLAIVLAAAVLTLLPALARATGDADSATCPNESLTGFRAYLGQCRAYEQVTPTFKAGGAPSYEASSPDGSRILSRAVTLTGGVEGDQLEELYSSTRSGGGWVTSAMNPPSSELPVQEPFKLVSADLTRSLWRARRASESVFAQNLYVREPDGTTVEVGPMVPPSAAEGPPAGEYQAFRGGPKEAVGASSDLSRVFFQNNGNAALWPGDTTQSTGSSRTLYEYAGRGNTAPLLVGTNSEGALISSCTTSLGSITANGQILSADVYNAISHDGETVFFTAMGHNAGGECAAAAPEVDEVYARRGLSPGEVIAISEPSLPDCSACQTTPAVQQPAEFQGASEDGGKVFFLTTQELLTGANGENLYEYDFSNPAGQKIVRVSTGASEPRVLGVARVSEDGSHVYFVAEGVLTGANGEGNAPALGGANLYVSQRDATHPAGRLTFIGTLSATDHQDWGAEDKGRLAQATPDGEFLVFTSVADLVPGDTSKVPQMFEYHAATEELVRVSVGEPGYPAGEVSATINGAVMLSQSYENVAMPSAPASFLAVSNDGAVVVFTSLGLTRTTAASAAEKRRSVYVYRSVGALTDGRVFNVSDGLNILSDEQEGLDASGGDVLFRAAGSLVPADGDTQRDLYDARVGGGFPPVEASDCVTNASCQGSLGAVPVFGTPGTAVTLADGNLSGAANTPTTGHTHRPSRLQLLTKALRLCRHERPRRKRIACETRAHRRYRAKATPSGKR